MKPSTTTTEWRCHGCGSLLGIRREGLLHVKHRRVQLSVRGEVIAVCPRCAELNAARTDAAAPAGHRSTATTTESSRSPRAARPRQ